MKVNSEHDNKLFERITFTSNMLLIITAPFILALFLYYIPFSDGLYRTEILKMMQSIGFRIYILIIMLAFFWSGINAAFKLLEKLGVKVHRPQNLIRLVNILWLVHSLYILFYPLLT